MLNRLGKKSMPKKISVDRFKHQLKSSISGMSLLVCSI